MFRPLAVRPVPPVPGPYSFRTLLPSGPGSWHSASVNFQYRADVDRVPAGAKPIIGVKAHGCMLLLQPYVTSHDP